MRYSGLTIATLHSWAIRQLVGSLLARLPIMNAPPWIGEVHRVDGVGHEQPERDLVPVRARDGPLRCLLDQRLPEHAAGLHHRTHLGEQVAVGIELLRELP